jgi:hypothetical protein
MAASRAELALLGCPALRGRSIEDRFLLRFVVVPQTPEERELSALARAALEKAVLLDTFPKAVVDVYACVLEAGDSRLQAQASVRA